METGSTSSSNGVTLDLDRPEDARTYIQGWIEGGENIVLATDEEYLLLAKQLFLYCDPRPVLGEFH